MAKQRRGGAKYFRPVSSHEGASYPSPTNRSDTDKELYCTPPGGLIRPTFPWLFILITPLISHRGVECYLYSPHLWPLQQYLNIALAVHNKT